jgi:hypothetical protein
MKLEQGIENVEKLRAALKAIKTIKSPSEFRNLLTTTP